MKWKFIIFMFFIAKCSVAQQYFFVLVENASKKPFTVKVNDKVFSGNHFITVPKLLKGEYNFLVEATNAPTENFLVKIDANDLGFVLKPSPDKGLVMFDINSFKTLSPTQNENKIAEKQEVINKIQQNEVKPIVSATTKDIIMVETVKPADIIAPVVVPKIEEPKLVAPAPIVVKKETPFLVSSISTSRKIYENVANNGINQIYVINNGDKLDTVSVFIPQLAVSQIKETVKVAEPAAPITVIAKPDDAPTKNSAVNANCTTLISTPFFDQILQLINNESTDKAKLNKATSFFNKDCFTTSQIKQIGSLIENDYYKFDFYRASKKMVMDLQNFNTLKETIKEQKVQEMFTDLINN